MRALLLLLCSCQGGDSIVGVVRRAPTDTAAAVESAADTAPATAEPTETREETADETGLETGEDSGGESETTDDRCPPDMVDFVGFCMDRFEAFVESWSPYETPSPDGVAAVGEGEVPQAYISGDLAEIMCENAGKRLCTVDEWMRACQGPDGWLYPYGDAYDEDACNDSRSSHPIDDYFGDDPDRWDYDHMNDPGLNQQPDTVDPAGGNPDCVSAEGVYDLHGNLHEWIDDPAGTFKGGFYVDAVINGAGCTYTTTAHDFGYHDYSTGFRCCW